MIKDIITSKMGFTLWNVATVLIYRWNGLLPTMQSPRYNNVLISRFQKDIWKQSISGSDLSPIQTQFYSDQHYNNCFQIIFTHQLFLAVVSKETWNCMFILLILFYKLVTQTHIPVQPKNPRLETEEFPMDLSHWSGSWHVLPTVLEAS